MAPESFNNPGSSPREVQPDRVRYPLDRLQRGAVGVTLALMFAALAWSAALKLLPPNGYVAGTVDRAQPHAPGSGDVGVGEANARGLQAMGGVGDRDGMAADAVMARGPLLLAATTAARREGGEAVEAARADEAAEDSEAGSPTFASDPGVWPDALFRVSFAFFMGFCVGYALRAMFRMAMLVLGMVFLGLLLLAYGGMIQVDWSIVEARYYDSVAWLAGQTASFRAFAFGQLPATASVAGGLYIGSRRN